nr:MAG TPA: hypothetical protein [Bacteriophage sp.]
MIFVYGYIYKLTKHCLECLVVKSMEIYGDI